EAGKYQLGEHQIYRFGAFVGAVGGVPRRVDVPGGDAPKARARPRERDRAGPGGSEMPRFGGGPV
ncbi:MAG: hypothetical protein AAFV49_08355, partial [Pseudomonadota bacterium]